MEILRTLALRTSIPVSCGMVDSHGNREPATTQAIKPHHLVLSVCDACCLIYSCYAHPPAAHPHIQHGWPRRDRGNSKKAFHGFQEEKEGMLKLSRLMNMHFH